MGGICWSGWVWPCIICGDGCNSIENEENYNIRWDGYNDRSRVWFGLHHNFMVANSVLVDNYVQNGVAD